VSASCSLAASASWFSVITPSRWELVHARSSSRRPREPSSPRERTVGGQIPRSMDTSRAEGARAGRAPARAARSPRHLFGDGHGSVRRRDTRGPPNAYRRAFCVRPSTRRWPPSSTNRFGSRDRPRSMWTLDLPRAALKMLCHMREGSRGYLSDTRVHCSSGPHLERTASPAVPPLRRMGVIVTRSGRPGGSR
jgi:hypothetical protein